MTNNEFLPWICKGTEVASVRLGQNRLVTYSKIDRVGKRYLFLENGEKFHALGLDRQVGGLVGGTNYRLYKADDPLLAEIELDIAVKKTMNAAATLATEFSTNPTVGLAEDLVQLLIPFTRWELKDYENNQE